MTDGRQFLLTFSDVSSRSEVLANNVWLMLYHRPRR